jgi:hypothetical protein
MEPLNISPGTPATKPRTSILNAALPVLGPELPVLNAETFGFIISMCSDKLGNSGSKSSNFLVSFVFAWD